VVVIGMNEQGTDSSRLNKLCDGMQSDFYKFTCKKSIGVGVNDANKGNAENAK
jgi:hypothetical protein